MIYKRCGYCGRRIEAGKTCSICGKRMHPSRASQDERQMRSSNRWSKLRMAIKAKYSGVDVYAWCKYGRMEPAEAVHHIQEAHIAPAMFYREDNLIPVSARSHAEIHRRYKSENIKSVQSELSKYLREWGK